MQSLSRIYRIGSDKEKPVQFTFLQSVFTDGQTETIDHKIDVVLKKRIKQMYALLNDDFALHPLDLDASASQLPSGSMLRDDDVQKIYADIMADAKDHGRVF